jgi:hypothetical protein
MATLALITLLLGAALGVWFRALVLVPAGVLVLIGSALAGASLQHPILAAFCGISGLQLGYLAGITIRHLPVGLRKSWNATMPVRDTR